MPPARPPFAPGYAPPRPPLAPGFAPATPTLEEKRRPRHHFHIAGALGTLLLALVFVILAGGARQSAHAQGQPLEFGPARLSAAPASAPVQSATDQELAQLVTAKLAPKQQAARKRPRPAATHTRRTPKAVARKPAAPALQLPPRQPVTGGQASAFSGRGIWIWYLDQSAGGDLAKIASQAKAAGATTLFIKAADGTNWWPQFDAQTLATLKAQGLKVCAWQYIYGVNPRYEAALGARAAALGADCLVTDAEIEFQRAGGYKAAQAYVAELRSRVGADYPLGLSSFAYVDYHGAFPYSAFLGPGGEQFNLPQVYWRDFGTSPDEALARSWSWNSIYGRPMAPIGQLYGKPKPKPAEIAAFGMLAASYGAPGTSWWSWQSARPSAWQALNTEFATLAEAKPAPAYPVLARGMNGDPVRWAQLLLTRAGAKLPLTARYGAKTEQAVSAFQAAHSIPQTGQIGPLTWAALLRYR